MKVRILTIGFVLAVVMGFSASPAQATTYTGCLAGSAAGAQTACTDGDLTTSASWTGAILSWVVDDTTNPGYWTYTYTFNENSTGAQLSHSIIEVSASFTEANLISENCSGESSLGDFSSDGGQPNPGFVGDAGEGFKCNSDQVVTLVSDRIPVWGDWYAKDGNTDEGGVYAYNAGLLAADPLVGPHNGSELNHVLVPDSVNVVPEPGSIALLGTGLLSLSGAVRKRLRKNRSK